MTKLTHLRLLGLGLLTVPLAFGASLAACTTDSSSYSESTIPPGQSPDGGVGAEGGVIVGVTPGVATVPAEGTIAEPKDIPVVTATFDKAMDPASIGPTSFIVSAGNTSVGGAVTFEGQTATFKPTVPLTVGETFRATLTTAVKDATGTPLAANVSWSFSTTSDFGIQVPEFDVPASSEMYFCYHFRTPNDREIALKSLSSTTQGVAKSLAVILTSTDVSPPGFVSAANCHVTTFGPSATDTQGAPIYQTHDTTGSLTFPDDDGAGKPLAMRIPANQAGYVRMRVLNPSDAVAKVSASLRATALPMGTAYTRIAPFITSSNQIDVPANAVGDVETRICEVPVGAKFWRFTTHTHNRATNAQLLDGATPLVTTTNWEAPAVSVFPPPAFKTLTSGKLTYSCTYSNPGPRRLSGSNPFLDEACMGWTYYFPASPSTMYLPALDARFCLNTGLLP